MKILKEKERCNVTSKEFLLELNKRGLIPGPEESEESFFARCKRCIPSTSLPNPILDMFPDWIHINYQRKGLHFWEGGCTWIEGNRITLQLHPSFLKKKRHWGYHQDEILAHECIHAFRGAFAEPIFEEILAYRTSTSPFRSYWGPLLRTSGESLLAVFMLLGCTLAPFFQFLAWIAWGGTLLMLSWLTLRLIQSQRIFKCAFNNIAMHFGSDKAMAIMIHLNDKEIIQFAKKGSEEIVAYSIKMAKNHIRWQQIRAAYF